MYNEKIRNRIQALRQQMRQEEIDYYLVVTDDYHSSEYVCEYFKCREYLSGFTGSNGDLLVWQDGAALWTDGRYFLQAEDELEGTGISLMKMGEKGVPTIQEFLEKEMLPGQRLGFDGKTIRVKLAKTYEKAITKVNAKACMDAENPTDSGIVWDIDLSEKVWASRPELPRDKAWLLDEQLTGESRNDRLSKVREQMKKKSASAILFSSLDDIAWLLLLRGNDIEYNPVVLSYMILGMDGAYLYTDEDKFGLDIKEALLEDGIMIRPYEKIIEDLKSIDCIENVVGLKEASVFKAGGKVLYDENRTTYALLKALEIGVNGDESRLICDKLPTQIMKAVKTKQEVENEKLAHIKDGVAVTKLLYWLHCIRESEEFGDGKCKVTELDVAEKLLELRRAQKDFIEESFAPIIATAEHGAIIHYEPTAESNKELVKDNLLLMDTGGQYLQGTTDITRTICMGNPSRDMQEKFTAVLRGHLSLMAAIFPEGTTGPNLDILARKPLWEIGLDYKHGTGHGVGYLLNVHEGPQNINQRGIAGMLGTAFVPGMITSDEPGVYITNQYGIRTENMIVCTEAKDEFYGFTSLTLVPYDKRLIDISLMKEDEIKTLNEYNKKVWEAISPYLSDDEKDWLREETLTEGLSNEEK